MGFRETRQQGSGSGFISFETAEAYREAGRLDEVLPVLEQAVSHYTRRLGPGDPDTVTFRVYLAAAYQQMGRLLRPSGCSRARSKTPSGCWALITPTPWPAGPTWPAPTRT